jgi:RNA polymerase sigma-70 factor (ECF subfamily)
LGQEVFDIHDYLIERCKSGDAIAQEEIYRRYAKNMYNTAYRILAHQAEAEDVLQESFLEVFTKIADWRGDSTFGAWLKRIVVNRSISLLRKRRVELIESDEVENIADDTTEFDFDRISDKLISWIKKGIENLPEGYRLVLSLYLLEGYDHVEISEILNISESTSKTQYLRAKDKLRNLLVQQKEYTEFVQ